MGPLLFLFHVGKLQRLRGEGYGERSTYKSDRDLHVPSPRSEAALYTGGQGLKRKEARDAED